MIAVQVIASALKKELWSYFSTEAHRDWDMTRYINSAARAIAIAKNFDFNQYETQLVVTEWITAYSIPYQIETYFVKKDDDEVEVLNFPDYHKLSNADKDQIVCIWWENAKSLNPWTYDIFYRWFPPTITSLTDSLQIPEHFYDLVLLKATYFWYMDIRAFSKAAGKEEIFKWMIKDMATRSSNPQPKKTKRLNKSKNKIW